jgi:hypothetical protein
MLVTNSIREHQSSHGGRKRVSVGTFLIFPIQDFGGPSSHSNHDFPVVCFRAHLDLAPFRTASFMLRRLEIENVKLKLLIVIFNRMMASQ